MDPRRELNGIDEGPRANDSELPLSHVFEEWKPQLARADRELRLFIRRNPVAALATATVAGFLLARLLRR